MQSQRPVKPYYLELEVEQNATPHQIKKAYRRLALKWHPDKHEQDTAAEKESAANKFKAIQNAYETLADPVKRQNYDNSSEASSAFNYTDSGEYNSPSSTTNNRASFTNNPSIALLAQVGSFLWAKFNAWAEFKARQYTELNPQLIDAITRSDVTAAEDALLKGASADVFIGNEPALHYAIKNTMFPIAELLISYKTSLTTDDLKIILQSNNDELLKQAIRLEKVTPQLIDHFKDQAIAGGRLVGVVGLVGAIMTYKSYMDDHPTAALLCFTIAALIIGASMNDIGSKIGIKDEKGKILFDNPMTNWQYYRTCKTAYDTCQAENQDARAEQSLVLRSTTP